MIGGPLLLGDDGYTISRSVRLRSSASAYFSRTPGSAGNRQTWTWSGWVKRTPVASGGQILLCAGNSGDFVSGGSGVGVSFDNDRLACFGGNTGTFRVVTNVVSRDPSAWYHIVVAFDTTQATASNRVQMWVNNQLITTFDTTPTYPSQNSSFQINNASIPHFVGAQQQFTSNYFDGYLTDVYLIDGQALTPSAFGETDTVTGVWKPKRYTGTYGTNGFKLDFSDNSAATAAAIGKDYSGNGNNWTPNNISLTSGATYDSMLDVPTPWGDRGNFCVLNPAIRPYPSADNIADGNLKFTSSSASVGGSAWSTIPVTTGKWYAECTVTTASASSSDFIGVSSDLNLAALGTYSAALRDYGYTYKANGNKCNNSATGTTYGASYTSGDVIGVALDAGAGTIEFFKNGTSQGTAYTGMTYSGGFLFGSTAFNGGVHNWNFGQRPFAYTPPSGFKALNTQNLPEPTIKKGNAYFDTSLYTGNGGSITVTNAGFQPDLVWIKARSSAFDHKLVDAVRGASGGFYYDLSSNSTSAESLPGAGVNSLTSTGFTIGGGTNNGYNGNGTTFAAWQWKEGATQGFDIVTYTGNGVAGRTVAHSLGVSPSMVIVKNRSSGTPSWMVAHSGMTAGRNMILNGTDAQFLPQNAAYGGITSFNSTTFTTIAGTLGQQAINANGDNYVAYLFSAVSGFSAFGSYTGNGSADGPFVFTGHRPRFIMVKRTDTVNNWIIQDTARDTSNVSKLNLLANTSAAENTNDGFFDILSNGFKMRSTDGGVNASGGTYIFAAFAENPFKYSLAR